MQLLRDEKSLGRPALSNKQKDLIFHKVEPYLKAGLSLNKACKQAQLPPSTVYDLYSENREFAERIDIAKNYYSVLVSSIITNLLEAIYKKQNKSPKNKLTSEEIRFIQWVALNSHATKEEFGARIEEEKKDNSPTFKIINDPKALITVLKTYESFRDRMIKENKYFTNGQEAEANGGV